MERVSREWLSIEWMEALKTAEIAGDDELNLRENRQLAFAQAVAREVLRVIEYRMLRDSPERALQDARARFGLEDE